MSDASKRSVPKIENEIDLYAESKRLRNRLLKIEEQLSLLPWKSETLIKFRSNASSALSFQRSDPKWRLYVFDVTFAGYENPTLAVDTSVEVQSEVASALPLLIERMREQFDAKSKAVRTGHAALDELEKKFPETVTTTLQRLVLRDREGGSTGKAGS